MSLKELEQAFILIDENEGDFAGAKTPEIIRLAENKLGLCFPPTYKKFLLQYGCGDVEGLELYGVISEDFESSGIPDGIWLTLKERKSGLPKELVIINSTGDGTYMVLDTDTVDSNLECPVYAYDTEGEKTRIYDDYGSFLLSELKIMLE